MQIKELSNSELIDLALETQEEQVRQAALVEHNRRVNADLSVVELPASATIEERKAMIEAQLGSAAA